jgi:hypothetical protein
MDIDVTPRVNGHEVTFSHNGCTIEISRLDWSDRSILAETFRQSADKLDPPEADAELAALRALRARLDDDALAETASERWATRDGGIRQKIAIDAIASYRAALREGL